jgi:uncharacterized protein with HEPN domain
LTDDRQRKKLRRYLHDIVAFGESILSKLHGLSLETFGQDDDLRDLTTYRLQCVSEATRNVLLIDPAIADRNPGIPWRNVRDIGNVLRHDYQNVDAELIWELVNSGKLHTLIVAAQNEIKAFEG